MHLASLVTVSSCHPSLEAPTEVQQFFACVRLYQLLLLVMMLADLIKDGFYCPLAMEMSQWSKGHEERSFARHGGRPENKHILWFM